MSPPAGQDEDDGGFLNTSARSKGSRPNSQQIDEAQIALINQGHPIHPPQNAPTVSTGVSTQSIPASNNGSAQRITSNQGASANLSSPYQGNFNNSRSSPSQGGQGDKSMNTLSYTEFTRGLLSVTKNPPLPVSTGENMNLRLSESGFVPSSFYLNHHDAKDQRHRPASRGRSGRGYESDTGYKSDTQVYRRKKHYNPDGYASDWEAVQRHHMSQKYLQRDGYSSDYDAHSRRAGGAAIGGGGSSHHHYYRPHSSYHPSSQSNVSYSNSASQRSIASQRSGSHHSIASQNQRPASYGSGRPTVNQGVGGGSGGSRQQPLGYTNVPSTKRTMLRNDEMYEMYPGARNGSTKPNLTVQQQQQQQQRSQSKLSLTASNTSITHRQNTDPRQSNPSLVNVQHTPVTPPPNRHAPSQQNTPSRNYNPNTPGNQSEDWNTPVSQQKTNLTKESGAGGGGGSSTEDEIWRAQLYQASVKLQKTPSEKRKQRQVGNELIFKTKNLYCETRCLLQVIFILLEFL